MKINEDELIKKLGEYWDNNKHCPICNNSNWGIENRLVTPIGISEKKSIMLGGQISPLIQIMCDKCGYTFFMNALKLGVLDMLEEENKDGK